MSKAVTQWHAVAALLQLADGRMVITDAEKRVIIAMPYGAVLGLPFSIWGFVVMGCLKGTVGPNKYGDDPLQPLQEVFA